MESKIQKGEKIPENHLRAWRIAREEILGNVLVWVRLVIENFYAWAGVAVDKERLFQQKYPDELWKRIEIFLVNLSALPCWIDKNLSSAIYGGKQNMDFWKSIFDKGIAPNNVRVLTKPLKLLEMIQDKAASGGKP